MSKLYLVATPIGNLGDITIRALEILKSVDVIACEDTRHTLPLLTHFDIKKPLISYYKHKEKEGAEKIISLLNEGKDVALVSDAGMPCISDPGSEVVKELLNRGYEYTVVPGASAVVSAIALTGVDGSFSFIGFLPEKKKDITRLLAPYKDIDTNLVFYVAPHDVEDTIKVLYDNLGDRPLYAVKEITKIHEKVIVGRLSGITIENQKGEFVFVVGRPDGEKEEVSEDKLRFELSELIFGGMDKKTATKTVAEKYGISKNIVYKLSIDI